MNKYRFLLILLLSRFSVAYHRKAIGRLEKELQRAESGMKIAPRFSFLYEYSRLRADAFRAQLSALKSVRNAFEVEQ